MRNISSEKTFIGPWHHDRQRRPSGRLTLAAIVVYLGLTGGVMARERVLISSEWGNVTADLADNDAARSLVRQLPLTIAMRDHLRQEKTGGLPSPLPEIARQTLFSKGTLGLWSSDHFVIYYRDGRVPQPGIIILGQVIDDVSIFDRPGPVTVRISRSE
jgi:hypothetical protein